MKRVLHPEISELFSRRRFLATGGMALLAHGSEGVCRGTPLNVRSDEPQPIEGTEALFWRPKNAWVGDTIPFFQDGEFRIFYLHDWRDRSHQPQGTSWYQVATKDCLHYRGLGEAIPQGAAGDQDASVATGSVISANGRFYAIYTGYGHERKLKGDAEQGICQAVSDDLQHWQELPERMFFADTSIYEKDDWRDPFVFWNNEAGEYWLLCAARLREGPARRRGCTALCISKDLITWEIKPPFYAPGLYETHECPDLFQHEGWWYLIFSEFSDQCVTRYRMSRSIHGPWITPAIDTFDGRAFYAAKTASDGQRRVLFGWIPTRNNDKDYAFWNWGGTLGAHELSFLPDRCLGVRPAANLQRFLGRRESITGGVPFRNAQWNDVSTATVNGKGGFASLQLGQSSGRWRLHTKVRLEEDVHACGVSFHADSSLSNGYTFRMEPMRNRLVVESYPRPDANSPYMIGLERPLRVDWTQAISVSFIVDGNIAVLYVNGETALTARIEHTDSMYFGFFAEGGRTTWTEVEVFGS